MTVWRAIHEAHKSGEHVVVRWWNRTYHGHVTEIDVEGFRLSHTGDGPKWCDWRGTKKVEPPWWDTSEAAQRVYDPCEGCIAYHRRPTRRDIDRGHELAEEHGW